MGAVTNKDGITLMQAFENRFLRLLAGEINASIKSRLEQLADPTSKAKDYAEYIGRVQAIATLREVIVSMERIEKDLSLPESEADTINRARRSSRTVSHQRPGAPYEA